MFRQRYVLIDQVFSLSSIEVESPQRLSRMMPPGPSPLSLHPSSSQNVGGPRILWKQKAEDVLWLASAFFILYYGDFRSNFFSLLANDPRIWRPPLHIALGCLLSDFFMLLYLAIWLRITQQKLDLTTASAIQAPTIVAFAAFILLSIALWPVWNILTVPMLFTLFMALVVVVLNVLPYIDVKMDPESMLPLHEIIN